MGIAPLEVVSAAWRRRVITEEGEVDRRAYTLCVLERLQDSLRRRDVFVRKSDRWGDPRAKLLHGTEWETVRAHVCHTLGREQTAAEELRMLGRQVDEAFRRTATNLPTNTAVSIEDTDGRASLTVTGLDKLEEPPALVALRQQVEALLPHVDLPRPKISAFA